RHPRVARRARGPARHAPQRVTRLEHGARCADDRGMPRLRALPLLFSSAVAAGCASVPEDHLLRQRVAAVGRDLRTVSIRELERAGRSLAGVGNLASGALRFPARSVVDVAELRDSGADLAALTGERLARAPAALTARTLEQGGDAARRLRSLGQPLRWLPHRDAVGAEIARRRAALLRLPTTLRLDRLPLSHPTDPNRVVTVEPTSRRASWLE